MSDHLREHAHAVPDDRDQMSGGHANAVHDDDDRDQMSGGGQTLSTCFRI